ncbi:MAG TPA: DUF1028 domain-containing protein [Bacillota bacterium]|nr:DUF1028 domain-containing protein [Bacillota bacterium]
MTFSIVAYDPKTDELGVAVQSKFISVGSVVPWAKAGVGAIATQSVINTTYGPDGLKFLAEGKSVEETIKILTDQDDGRDFRQVGIIDATGNGAAYTGKSCYDWAGDRVGKNCVAQGNILVSEAVVDQMVDVFEQTEGHLAERLLTALDAGQAAGGDRRGKQAAALYIVKEKGGYLQKNDRMIDLRVDEHPDPIKELMRIYKLHQLYFGATKKENILTIDEAIRKQIEQHLHRLGRIETTNIDDATFYKALSDFHRMENFEGRELERGKIDQDVLNFLVNLS